jgi:hypothetical protein
VQGHPGNACGKSCPAGQGLASDGRCQTTAVLAQQQGTRRSNIRVAEAPSRPVAGQSAGAKTEAGKSEGSKPESGKPEAGKSVTAKTDATWNTTVTAAVVAPAAAYGTPAAVALAPRSEVFEGRMAIGAPVTTGAPEPSMQPRIAALPTSREESDQDAEAPKAKQRVAPAQSDRRQAQPERRPTPPQNVYGAPRTKYVAAPGPQYYYAPKPSYQASVRTLNQRVFTQLLRDGR